ncbi:ferredoxin [Sulfitobacter albidus]|uniref:Ferredoxin n=1 Tax=Sulfitobacter albidus TaxID=2829501 RepID=A0A975JC67_9RHOB|nr:ferredoxin [Sulfitobacter albidus]QUJ75657.1 ferredoxin [Sulfitobacter albidus]
MIDLAPLCAPHGLMPMGALHENGRTIALIGADTGFWEAFSDSAEALDGGPDPIDRWSTRVIPELARGAGADGHEFPFGGPPFAPYISWAKATREAFSSPTGMLVHTRAGLMISYRGALIWDRELPLAPPASPSPCDPCARPCETACPVGALSPDHFYDVPRCKAHLATPEGAECLNGCLVRRACPISQSFDRPQAQSAHHMRYFIGEMS